MTDCMNSVSGNKGSSHTQPDKKEYVLETDNKYIDYFISGEQDYTCATSYARKYYEDITAPKKAFYEIKGCSHTPQADKPEEVAGIIAGLGRTM